MSTDTPAPLPAELSKKHEALKEHLAKLGAVAVAFSGGVDSTLLLSVAADVLGDNTVAITARAQMIPAREVREASDFCAKRGIRHVVMDVDALTMDQAARLGIPYVAEGTNTSDLGDYRPGLKALGELKVDSPLLAAGLSKSDVRALSHKLGLPTWDKPSYACLASRIPYKEAITAEKLRSVEHAEDALMDAGFPQIRCRAHGDLARIEVAPDQRAALMDALISTDLTERIHDAGFAYVTVDADGYRTGSLNQNVPE